MVHKVALLTLLLFLSFLSSAQISSYDSLKSEIIKLEVEVQTINLNLNQAQAKFQTGLIIATIGYATTITGGLMLGRENDELGQVLLVTGGATGIYGTYKMFDAFRYLTGTKRKKKK